MMSVVNRLTVKNFGPIKEVEVVFNRFTVFVGPQGVGKSTLAKLYSMFLWLEKRLIRGLENVSQVERDARFKKNYCGYHRLTSYFLEDTYMEFIGRSYSFTYRDGKLRVREGENSSEANVVKVMYVPSERNFLSSLGNLSGLKSLPLSLQTFKNEYDAAVRAYASGYRLPIDGVRFEYDKLNNIPWLAGTDYKVRLTDASSGFQAVLPMLIVSKYLTDIVASRHDESGNNLNMDERDKLRDEVRKVMENKSLLPEVRDEALSALSSRFAYSGFVNVVEEPEENLYPASQRSVLYNLLSLANIDLGNSLVITTHSPYLINYLTLAVKAGEVMRANARVGEIAKIVPEGSCISADEVSIYELSDGRVSLLSMPGGIPSDGNFLNKALGEANELFGKLLDIEEYI